MLSALRRLAAFCFCVILCFGLITPQVSHADSLKPDDLAVIRRQAEAFQETEQRLPELGDLVRAQNWTFTRNLIHGPMQEVGREMLYINQRLNRSERKQADRVARSLKEALADLDEAARLQDPSRLNRSYDAVLAGFDAYAKLIPSEALS
ncbi:MAG: photosystem II protein PsbQ [Cyanobium sp. NAT70]|nr:photosystem II protein PsbQ [Cyanobium sp. NAT70]|tara:strand:- start:2218 stop:2667 length:450 start_codon:yes stop_codon:yes gene_type:complete